MELLHAMNERHSVRKYVGTPIETDKRELLNAYVEAANVTSGLSMQVFYDEPECFTGLLPSYGKMSNVTNYIALVGPKSADLEEQLGYYGEQLVIQAQMLGLQSCWVAGTYKKGKCQAVVGKDEKLVCVIALGYGETTGRPRKTKTIEQVSNYTSEMPMWFKAGVEAAMLAPTAMNQQKFHFTYENGSASAKVAGLAFYTKLDLGIVKYHFEAISGQELK